MVDRVQTSEINKLCRYKWCNAKELISLIYIFIYFIKKYIYIFLNGFQRVHRKTSNIIILFNIILFLL